MFELSDKYFESSTPLSDEVQETFQALTSGEYKNFALLRGEFDGAQASFIVAIERDNACECDNADCEGAYVFSPLGLIFEPDDALLARCMLDGEALEPV